MLTAGTSGRPVAAHVAGDSPREVTPAGRAPPTQDGRPRRRYRRR